MTSSINEGLGVATSGVSWDVGDFKLYQSSREDTILFTKKHPSLLKGSDGRYHFSLFIYRQQIGDTYKITGGSLIFTLSSAISNNPEELYNLKESWRTAIVNSGNAKQENPIFFPLRMEGGTAQLLYDKSIGTPHQAHNDIEAGTPGGTNTFLVELTELGAQVCLQGVKEEKGIPFGVLFSYDYLRWLPKVNAVVSLDGKKVFEHLSTNFKTRFRSLFVSDRTEINILWEEMCRDGVIQIIGTGSPELEKKLKSQLITTFADYALKSWFNLLFEPVPEVESASSSGSSGFSGGVKYAMKWVKIEDAVDLELKIEFDGWSTFTQDTDVGGMALFSDIDESYIIDIPTQVSYPANIVVDPDEMLENVSITWNAMFEEKLVSPLQNANFNSQGGNKSFIITSQNSDQVVVSYSAYINYKPNNWPIIKTEGSLKGKEGTRISLKTGSWIGRIKINMEIRNENGIVSPSQDSKGGYLIVNISYKVPHIATPIQESIRMTSNEPLEFVYLNDFQGRPSKATISVFGLVGGSLIQTNKQTLDLDTSVLLLIANKEGVEIVAK